MMMSSENVLHIVLAYRDIQAYDSIIKLVTGLMMSDCVRLDIENDSSESAASRRKAKVTILTQLAMAYNRRRQKGDSEWAQDVLLRTLLCDKRNWVPDTVCLCGRIYKDRFLSSNYEDKEALHKAIHWYREGYKLDQSDFASINLATLLVVDGKKFDVDDELDEIGMSLNHSLGKKGKLESQTDYWTVATVFELSVLLNDYSRALMCCLFMFQLKPPVWYLKSTMNNINLIINNRPPPSFSTPIMEVFSFWIDFFQSCCEEESGLDRDSFHVLLLEPMLGVDLASPLSSSSSSSSYPLYQPCRLQLSGYNIELYNVSQRDFSDTVVSAIGQVLPKIPCSWNYHESEVLRITLLNDDMNSLILYAGLNEFRLTFASEYHRNGFDKCVKGLESDGNSSRESANDSTLEISWEYLRDSRGNRVVLGRGGYGVVYSGTDSNEALIAIKEVPIDKNTDKLQSPRMRSSCIGACSTKILSDFWAALSSMTPSAFSWSRCLVAVWVHCST
jgi:mitogen-activated protein kinase kinase kinase 5